MTATIAPAIPIRPQAAPALTQDGRYLACTVAASFHRCGRDTESLRRLFSRCEAKGYGVGTEFEYVALSRLAALAVSP